MTSDLKTPEINYVDKRVEQLLSKFDKPGILIC